MNEHPISKMSEVDLLEMECEWNGIVEEMSLMTVLGEEGFAFSYKMFKEAYSRGLMKYKPEIPLCPHN